MNRLLALGIAGALIGGIIKTVENTAVGPCGPALDDWSERMAELMKEYNAKHPDSPLTNEQAREKFESINPQPKPMRLKDLLAHR